MKLSDAGRLLDPAPMALEMGYERLLDGVLHVAIRTDLHRCTGRMFEWWFGSRPGAREYAWWHPLDHVGSAWAGGQAGSSVGAVHLVEERFCSPHVASLSIQFRDPAEVFDPTALQAARDAGAVSAVVVARGGEGHDARRTPAGEVIGTRLIHLCRDTKWGMVLRTHFFLGQDMPGIGMPLPKILEIFPDSHAPGLLQHCYEEFSNLSRFLPALYEAENRDTISWDRPW